MHDRSRRGAVLILAISALMETALLKPVRLLRATLRTYRTMRPSERFKQFQAFIAGIVFLGQFPKADKLSVRVCHRRSALFDAADSRTMAQRCIWALIRLGVLPLAVPAATGLEFPGRPFDRPRILIGMSRFVRPAGSLPPVAPGGVFCATWEPMGMIFTTGSSNSPHNGLLSAGFRSSYLIVAGLLKMSIVKSRDRRFFS